MGLNKQVAPDGEIRNAILFNASKREIFTTNSGYKSLQKRLRSNWKIQSLKEDITAEKLEGVKLWITSVRNVYYKYFHPKEALISNGVLNREISRAAGKDISMVIDEDGGGNNAQALTFLYPYGATLNIMKPAIAALSTGSVCFPLNRPILGFYQSKGGKLAVLGSCHMFSDQYLDKEENAKILDVLMQWLTTNDIRLNQIDAEDPEISDYTIRALAVPLPASGR
uniref:IFT52 GIFT domain-containing protein n=1 Tax=Leptobrachium leishanense TaxID=445787 RepID=A0A8C5MY82_9ANUR